MPRAAFAPVVERVSALTRAGRRRRVFEDGIWFDSQAEHRRYRELLLLQRAGEISDLRVHPRYDLTVNGTHVCSYIPDFRYLSRGGAVVVEDVKSPVTRKLPEYRIKAALFEALYKHPVVEVVCGGRPRRRR